MFMFPYHVVVYLTEQLLLHPESDKKACRDLVCRAIFTLIPYLFTYLLEMASMSLKSTHPMAILQRSKSKRLNDLCGDSFPNNNRGKVLSWASTVEDSDLDLDLEEGEIREAPFPKMEPGYGSPRPRPAFPDSANKRRSYADACDHRDPSRSIPHNSREDREYPPSWKDNSVSTSIPCGSTRRYSRTSIDTYRPGFSYEPSYNAPGSSFDDRGAFCGLSNRRDSRRDSISSTAVFSSTEPLRPRNRIGKPTRRDSRLSNASYQRSLRAYSELSLGQSVRASMRPSDKWRGGEIEEGMVISAPYHTQAHHDMVDPADEYVSFTEFGPVHSKYRKLIVVGVWAEHLDCLPLYSYNGRGLENRESIADEYMHIRDHADLGEGAGTARRPPLKARRDERWKGNFINSSTVVKLTERFSLPKKDKCSLEGRLTEESLARVKDASYMHLQSKHFAASMRI